MSRIEINMNVACDFSYFCALEEFRQLIYTRNNNGASVDSKNSIWSASTVVRRYSSSTILHCQRNLVPLLILSFPDDVMRWYFVLFQIGDLVAARDPKGDGDIWFVAEVSDYFEGQYDLEHIDASDSTRCYRMERKFVQPLPLWRADPIVSPHAFFPCLKIGKYPYYTWHQDRSNPSNFEIHLWFLSQNGKSIDSVVLKFFHAFLHRSIIDLF